MRRFLEAWHGSHLPPDVRANLHRHTVPGLVSALHTAGYVVSMGFGADAFAALFECREELRRRGDHLEADRLTLVPLADPQTNAITDGNGVALIARSLSGALAGTVMARVVDVRPDLKVSWESLEFMYGDRAPRARSDGAWTEVSADLAAIITGYCAYWGALWVHGDHAHGPLLRALPRLSRLGLQMLDPWDWIVATAKRSVSYGMAPGDYGLTLQDGWVRQGFAGSGQVMERRLLAQRRRVADALIMAPHFGRLDEPLLHAASEGGRARATGRVVSPINDRTDSAGVE